MQYVIENIEERIKSYQSETEKALNASKAVLALLKDWKLKQIDTRFIKTCSTSDLSFKIVKETDSWKSPFTAYIYYIGGSERIPLDTRDRGELCIAILNLIDSLTERMVSHEARLKQLKSFQWKEFEQDFKGLLSKYPAVKEFWSYIHEELRYLG